MNKYIFVFLFMLPVWVFAQKNERQDSVRQFKKRVLENVEIDFLTSFYTQDGDRAAVTGGIGTEELDDFVLSFVTSIPLNDDDVLTIDATVSAYTSASSSNIDPFDVSGASSNGSQDDDDDDDDDENLRDYKVNGRVSPYQATSGASKSDSWKRLSVGYAHSSEDRNTVWSGNIAFSTEYDYRSFGFGGSLTKLFNQKNTAVSVKGNVYLDTWNPQYPSELLYYDNDGLRSPFFLANPITGNTNYKPVYSKFPDRSRNSYSAGLSFSQILSKNMQAIFLVDFVRQKGLLSTPYQRVYFRDVANSYLNGFHLADAVERLPDTRTKIALGGRWNWFVNEYFVFRTFYRYYSDDWGISSHTVSLEVPVKIADAWTVYPSFRFYSQTEADYYAPYDELQSASEFYTSDSDLSAYNAGQYGFGVTYKDIFTRLRIWKFGLKSLDLKFLNYQRDTEFRAFSVALGLKFVLD